MRRFFYSFFIILFLLLLSPRAFSIFGKPKPEKFFDLDKNRRLDRYERALLQTHQRFGWELADSKKKKEFDYNNDWMLGPQEWEQYENSDKKTNPAPVIRY